MKKNIKNLVFQITKQKAVSFSFITENEAKKYPVFEHYLTQVEQCLVVYKYLPGAQFSEEDYIKFLTKKLKTKYKAYSVIFLGSKLNEPVLKP